MSSTHLLLRQPECPRPARAVLVDGVCNPSEYLESLEVTWHVNGFLRKAWMHEHATTLHLCVEGESFEPGIQVYIDSDLGREANPEVDDWRSRLSSSAGESQSHQGNGSGWTESKVSGFSAAATDTFVVLAFAEFAIPLDEIGAHSAYGLGFVQTATNNSGWPDKKRERRSSRVGGGRGASL